MITETINKWGLPQLVDNSEQGSSPVEVLEERVRRSNFDFLETSGFVERYEAQCYGTQGVATA